MSTQQLSIQAQLAQAAYASLSAGMPTNNLEAALQAEIDGFTATQAQKFAAKHSVVLQYDDTSPQGNGTGLSLTVFKDKLIGKIMLDLRGLEADRSGFGRLPRLPITPHLNRVRRRSRSTRWHVIADAAVSAN